MNILIRTINYIFLIFTCLNVHANVQHYCAENPPKIYQDSIENIVHKGNIAWLNKDTQGVLEFRAKLYNSKLKRSQFYLYSGWIETMSGLWFGTYEDPDELGPKTDTINDLYDLNRREIIRNFYRMLDNKYMFKHFPERYRLYFVDLFMTSMDKGVLDTMLFKESLVKLDKLIKDSNINIDVRIKEIDLQSKTKGKYYYNYEKHFNNKDLNYFKGLMIDSFEDVSIEDSIFFEMASDLLKVIQLNFYEKEQIKISDYVFLNRYYYGDLRKYLAFFFRCYFESKLCFSKIPESKRNFIYNKLYMNEYNNIDNKKEFLKCFDLLYKSNN